MLKGTQRLHQFPGNKASSLAARWKYRSCRKSLLDKLRAEHGEIYWFYPGLGRSRVLVIYSIECAVQVLKEQSWLFNKALEPWHDRKQSRDPYERLIGDGLFLSDGNHHRKHSTFLSHRLESSTLIESIDSQLLKLFEQENDEIQHYESERCNGVLDIILASAYDIHLTGLERTELHHCIDLAISAASDRELCPYRLIKRKASQSTLIRIDKLRTILRQHLTSSDQNTEQNANRSLVSLSQTSILEEVISVCIGFMGKMPSLLESVKCEQSNMDHEQMQAVKMESGIKYQSLSTSCTDDSFWPATNAIIATTIARSESSYRLIKRVNVCDVEIQSVSVEEATEIWIPSWVGNNRFFYGAGCYSCKGEFLSQFIAGRYLQSLCGRVH